MEKKYIVSILQCLVTGNKVKANFIDIHTHILPGIDDGADTKSETMKILEMAHMYGTSDVIATSHYHPGRNYIDYERQNEMFLEVQKEAEYKYDIRLHSGNELYYFEGCVPLIAEHKIRTLAESRYVLLEFSPSEEYSRIFHAIQELQIEGYWVILAHVERYESLRVINRVEELVSHGAYIQMNSQTICGKFNWKQQYYVNQLMRKQLVHFIASDTHDAVSRHPDLSRSFQMIERKYGFDYAEKLLWRNPECILKNRFL